VISGYIAPEYAYTGVCSFKSGVFSFGVLVLEIVSGTMTNGSYRFDGRLYQLIAYVSKYSLFTEPPERVLHLVIRKMIYIFFSCRLGFCGEPTDGASWWPAAYGTNETTS
jgi:hypothetical protein